MSPIFIIGVTAAVVAVVVIAGYYIMLNRRGSVQVRLPKSSFAPGEKIKGSFTMTARGEIGGNRLYAALIGEEVTRMRSGGSRGSQAQTRVIYRDEDVIEEGATYAPGQIIERSFELAAPSASVLEDFTATQGKTLQVGSTAFTGSRTNLRWTVAVRLDAEGIDLSTSEDVTIDLP